MMTLCHHVIPNENGLQQYMARLRVRCTTEMPLTTPVPPTTAHRRYAVLAPGAIAT